MDKSNGKKTVIPELKIPDVTDYKPARSNFAKFATRFYVFSRTKTKILVGSLAILAISASALVFYNKMNASYIDESVQLADLNDLEKAKAVINNEIPGPNDLNTETSIKPFNIPDLSDVLNKPSENNEKVEEVVKDETPTSVASSNDNTGDKDQGLPVTSEKTSRIEDEKTDVGEPVEEKVISLTDFTKRFDGEIIGSDSSEIQDSLKESLSRIGTIEESMKNLKNSPFDLVVKPEVDEPKYALLKIVEGHDATSGFWREINTTSDSGKKEKREEHFLVVHSVDEKTNDPVDIEITDMDDGDIKKENVWAVLIPEKQFLDFAQSKKEDGTFPEPVLGKINLETGEIEWNIDTDGRALIDWKEFAE